MANMSYCMFENTANDLSDCVSRMEECSYHHQLVRYMNSRERAALEQLITSCREAIEQYDRLQETIVPPSDADDCDDGDESETM